MFLHVYIYIYIYTDDVHDWNVRTVTYVKSCHTLMRMRCDIDRKSSSVLHQSLTICHSSLLATGRITYPQAESKFHTASVHLKRRIWQSTLSSQWRRYSLRRDRSTAHFMQFDSLDRIVFWGRRVNHPHQSSLHQWDDCCLNIHPRYKRPIRLQYLYLHKVFVKRVMQSVGSIESVISTTCEYWYDWLIGDNDLLRPCHQLSVCLPSWSEVSSQSVVTVQPSGTRKRHRQQRISSCKKV